MFPLLRLFCFLVFLWECDSKGTLKNIGENDWEQMLQGEWMVEFYAPWCPACKALQPIWSEFAGWSQDLEISVGAVDITESPGLSGRFMITALPTIFHVKDGVFRQYKGARDREQLISFVEEKRWQELEPVSSWRSPDSLQMSLLSQFFRLSVVLRNVHSTLTEEYGLPVWGSYLLFVLGTVLVGALLGLLFVCCIDLCCAQKSATPAAAMTPPPDLSKKDDDVGGGAGDSEQEDEAEEGEEEEAEEGEDEEEEEGAEGEQERTGESTEGSPTAVRKRHRRRAD